MDLIQGHLYEAVYEKRESLRTELSNDSDRMIMHFRQ